MSASRRCVPKFWADDVKMLSQIFWTTNLSWCVCVCAGVHASACSHDPQPNWTWVQDIYIGVQDRYSFGPEALSHLGLGTKLYMKPNVSVQLHQNVKGWNKWQFQCGLMTRTCACTTHPLPHSDSSDKMSLEEMIPLLNHFFLLPKSTYLRYSRQF